MLAAAGWCGVSYCPMCGGVGGVEQTTLGGITVSRNRVTCRSGCGWWGWITEGVDGPVVRLEWRKRP
jgi:hypothetical protein